MANGTYLGGRGGSVNVSFVVEFLKILERGTWPLSEANHDGLSIIIAYGQTSCCALLRRLEKVVYTVVVNLVVADSHVYLGLSVFFELSTTTIYAAEKSGNDASVCQ